MGEDGRHPEARSLFTDHTTVKDIIQAVVSTHAGYEWRTEDGVVHVFQRDLVNDDRNPLNIIIKSFDEFDEQGETVGGQTPSCYTNGSQCSSDTGVVGVWACCQRAWLSR